MAIIEEDLWIELVCSTGSLEIHNLLHPATPAHIPRWSIADYPVFWNIVVKILGIVFCLVICHRRHEALAISSGEDERCGPEWCFLSDLGPPHPVFSEEFISTDQFSP